jgi:ubiquinone/menaquinone biosynthesis C-methylase UbiE
MTDRTRARALAAEALARGEPTGWFEQLYRESAHGTAVVPWADRAPNPYVVAWLDREAPPAGRALDVGTGLGDTAEDLARRGFNVVAFDVSSSAIEQTKARFPSSRVVYEVADLLNLPSTCDRAFDLVVECYTLQVLPPAARGPAIAALRRLVAPGGTLLVVARGRDPHEPGGEMPWPLTGAEIEAIADDALILRSLEDFLDEEDPPVRRFRAAFVHRPGAA